MSREAPILEEDAEELFENAPCGYITTRPDGTIVRVNRTFEEWTGLRREDLLAARLPDILSPGGRIYYETHYAPLLRMQGEVREIAVDIVCSDGSQLPALINSVLSEGEGERPALVRTTVFDATERRRYERELLDAQRREREIAERLQRSMLSGELPETPGLELDVAYRTAVAGHEVGGDWYDAFWVDHQVVGLAVGDVVGRGIEAAASMGQLRSALRALASTGLDPKAVVAGLDRFVARHQVGSMTTLVYAELSLASRELRFVCAGHPPPVIVSPQEAPKLAWGGRSMPLDAQIGEFESRPQEVIELEAGSTIVLYTDGLVERRTRSVAEGMDVLLDEVAAHAASASSLTEALMRAFHDPSNADDVCVLVARTGDVAG